MKGGPLNSTIKQIRACRSGLNRRRTDSALFRCCIPSASHEWSKRTSGRNMIALLKYLAAQKTRNILPEGRFQILSSRIERETGTGQMKRVSLRASTPNLLHLVDRSESPSLVMDFLCISYEFFI
jgi:hypothetical protein